MQSRITPWLSRYREAEERFSFSAIESDVPFAGVVYVFPVAHIEGLVGAQWGLTGGGFGWA